MCIFQFMTTSFCEWWDTVVYFQLLITNVLNCDTEHINALKKVPTFFSYSSWIILDIVESLFIKTNFGMPINPWPPKIHKSLYD